MTGWLNKNNKERKSKLLWTDVLTLCKLSVPLGKQISFFFCHSHAQIEIEQTLCPSSHFIHLFIFNFPEFVAYIVINVYINGF